VSRAIGRRLRASLPTLALAAVIYLPLLATQPGRVGADTKTYLYLDPGRMLERAWSMWDANIGMGTVTHQNIGYLWPIGPWYWISELAGLPDWVAQRLWLGTILFLAGLGVRFMLKAMGQQGPHVTAAMFVYALTPYVLSLAARLSVILLPYAGLPWMIGLSVLALRRGGWRYPALFGLTVATVGSVNATALLLAGVGPLLWILHEVAVTRSATVREAIGAAVRIGVMTIGCSLWWIAGLWAQGGYGIEILRYTETAATVAAASLSLEVLRGLGYWFFYGEDRFGPWIAPSRSYTQRVELLVLSFVLPVIGLIGAATVRFRERTYFVALAVVGMVLAVGAHPWDDPAPAGAAIKAFLQTDLGLSMRSLPRAAPLVVLALATFTGSLVAALTREHRRWSRPLAAGVAVLAVVGLPPLWRGQMVDENLSRDEEIPEYWREAAAALDARDDGTRVLEVPGIDFASYRWGTTVDPVTPGLMDRPYVARELIPYGSPPSADLLNAVDRRFQELVGEPAAIAPMARFMAVGDIVVRSDLTYERYNTPRPRQFSALVASADGLAEPLTFGGNPPNRARPDLPLLDELELTTDPAVPDPALVAIYGVEDAEPIVRSASTRQPVLLAGDGEGLVDSAAAGLVSGHELVFYAASSADDPEDLAAKLDDDAVLILTDTNRRRARRWSTVRDTSGITERAGQQALRTDPTDQRLTVFPEAGDDSASVIIAAGGVWAQATSYGNAVSFTPEGDPNNAVDGDPNTSWRTGGFATAVGERIRLRYTEPVTTDRIDLLQAIGGPRNRFITEVEARFDGGEPVRITLDASSRSEDPSSTGQAVEFAPRTFEQLDLTITETDPGELRRYDSVTAVGFAEIRVIDESGRQPVADNLVRLPVDLLDATGAASTDRPLAVVLTRERTAGTVAVRSDPEPEMARTFALPAPRSFTLSGDVRLSHAAPDPVIDAALGLPGADEGGVTATSRRRLPGGLSNRAMNAIDGDPATWYSPGFLGQQGEYVDYQLAEPITFDHLDLTVLNDGRHSVPRRLRLEVDGRLAQRIVLADVADQTEPNAQHTFDVPLDQPVTGSRIRLVVDDGVDAVRNVETLDWFGGQPLVTPIGLVELGIDGLEAPPLPDTLDDACQLDLVELDSRALPVTVTGTPEALLAGEALRLAACDERGVDLGAADTVLRTTAGRTTGLDIDRLVLRSAAGGDADPGRGPLVDQEVARDRPPIEVVDRGRTSTRLEVAEAAEPFWLVFGQSYNAGWRATADGEDLGPPTLVNGYANGWLVPAGTTIDLRVTWVPQRTVTALLAASLAFVAMALVVALWPRGRAAPEPANLTLAEPWAWSQVLRYAGPTPSLPATLVTAASATAAGWATIGPVGGLVLAGAAVVTTRLARARPLLTIGGPLVILASVAWMAVRQASEAFPSGFGWPGFFAGAQDPAWLGVLLIALDVVVERCWTRRWGPETSDPR
jgi:arabinofuranan 3-O-arabinosyltransferase